MQKHKRCSRIILGLLTLSVLTGTVLTDGPTQATSGPGPYYAEPGWDRKMLASNRFLILTNWNSEAVLDRETGLVWEKSPALTLGTWSGARLTCLDNAVGGRKGWRLPSIVELASLLDPSVQPPGPLLPTGHPFTDVQ